MNVYRVYGMLFCSDTMSGLMEYIIQQDDSFMASLNHRLIVKEQDGVMIALCRIEVDVDNRVLRFVRGKRG